MEGPESICTRPVVNPPNWLSVIWEPVSTTEQYLTHLRTDGTSRTTTTILLFKLRAQRESRVSTQFQGTLHEIRNPVPRASDLSATRAWGWRGGWRHSICTGGPGSPVGPGPGHARGSRGAKHPVPYAHVCPVGPLHAWAFWGKFSGESLSTFIGMRSVLLYWPLPVLYLQVLLSS